MVPTWPTQSRYPQLLEMLLSNTLVLNSKAQGYSQRTLGKLSIYDKQCNQVRGLERLCLLGISQTTSQLSKGVINL